MGNNKKVKNRWLIALAGIAIHLSIGSAYAWSVFTLPISDLTGWSTSQISFAFSLAIFFLGTSAAFMGHFVEKQGPRRSGMVAAVLFGVGVACTGFAVTFESLPLLYITYGVIGGAGLGTGYVTPVSTMIKWFPDRRGLATGMAIMGFGFAALITGPIAQKLIGVIGISNTFFTLGISYFIVMFSASLYLEKPPAGWKPKGFEEAVEADETKTVVQQDLSQLTANEAVKTRRFWLMWGMLFINITCGIALVAVASPMAQEITGMTAVTAATMVGVMGFFNGGGRFVWVTLSDYIGRPNTFTTFFIINVAALSFLYFAKVPILYMILIYIIMTVYGGGFAVIPAYIGDMFGTKELGAIHGYILTAWAMAGMAGPLILSFIYDLTGEYSGTLILFTIFSLIALALSLIIRLDIKRLRKKQLQEQTHAKAQ